MVAYFIYRVGNIECNIPWERPTKSKLLELVKYFNDNFDKAKLFKLFLHGAFVSNAKHTWDLDIKINFVDIRNKNYQDIFDCFHFLYYYGLNKFNILVDIKYTDNAFSTTHKLCNLIKSNQPNQKYSMKKLIDLDGETLHFTDTIEKRTNDEHWIQKREIYHNKIEVDGGELFVVNGNLQSITKFTSYVETGRIYYEDVTLNEACKINIQYFT